MDACIATSKGSIMATKGQENEPYINTKLMELIRANDGFKFMAFKINFIFHLRGLQNVFPLTLNDGKG